MSNGRRGPTACLGGESHIRRLAALRCMKHVPPFPPKKKVVQTGDIIQDFPITCRPLYHLEYMAMVMTLGLKIDGYSVKGKLFVWGRAFYHGVWEISQIRH